MRDERGTSGAAAGGGGATRAVGAVGLVLALVGTGSAGCDLANPGRPVPAATLNFPIALALAGPAGEPATALLVANSNFDLRFSAGSVQSFSVDAIVDAIESGERCDPSVTRYCALPDAVLPELLVDETLVGSHMDGLVLGSRRDRVYLPMRSGLGGLTWIELDAATGELECGGTDPASGLPSCDALHRGSDETEIRARGETLPSDPVALAVVPLALAAPTRYSPQDGDFVVMVHRNGNASLFLDTPGEPAQPLLLDTLTGIPNDVVSARVDATGLVWLTSGALASARATRDLVALQINVLDPLTDSEVSIARRVTLRGVDDGFDTRDIAVDTSRGPDDPQRMWVLSRRPEAVVTVDFELEPFGVGEAPLGAIHQVGAGPSRLAAFSLEALGRPGTLLLASCFDARNLYVIDPELGPIGTVPGLDGPFEITVDEATGRAFVVDFRFSVLWVVDLAPLATGGSPRLLARIGSGRAPSVFR